MKVIADEQDRANSLALVKVLTIAAIKLKGGKIVELKTSIANKIYHNALSFVKEYNNDDATIFENLWANILKKSNAIEPIIAELTPMLREMLRTNDMRNKLDLVSTDAKEVLMPLLAFFAEPSSINKFDTVVRKSKLLKEPTITNKLVQVFKELADTSATTYTKTHPDDEDTVVTPAKNTGAATMAALIKQIVSLGKQITGRNNVTKLTQEEKNEYNQIAKNKPLIREFNALRAQLTNVKKNEVRSIVVESGKQQIPLRDLVKGLKRLGNNSVSTPVGIRDSTIIYVNTSGEYCDKDGRIAVRQAAGPDAIWEDNPNYNHNQTGKGNSWLFKIIINGKPNYVLTQQKVGEARAKNFDKVEQVLENGIEKVKASWRSDMGSNLEDENTIFAYIAEYMFWTVSRVGADEGSSDGSRTYGASNFLVKHIIDLPKSGAAPSKLTVRYPVKSGATITFVLSTDVSSLPNKSDGAFIKKLIDFIVRKAKGKKPTDIVFSLKGEHISTNRLNAYLRSKLGVTAKSFRTLRGTELAIVALDAVSKEIATRQAPLIKKGKKLPQRDVDQLFDVAMRAVGELLGHVRRSSDDGEEVTTSTTAIKSYVNPHVMLDFYKKIGYAPNAKVVSAARGTAGVEV